MSSSRLGAAPAGRALPVVVEDVRRGAAAVVVPTHRRHAVDLDVVVPTGRVLETATPAVGVVRRDGDRHRSGVGGTAPSCDVRVPVRGRGRGGSDPDEGRDTDSKRGSGCCDA